jgi:gluconolactonase
MTIRTASLLFAFFLLVIPVRAQSPVPPNAVVERVAQGFQFVEGPVWAEGALLFSDIPGNKIYRWSPDSGATVYYEPSSNSNGLALDASGKLLLAQHGSRQVARLEDDRTETPLATEYESLSLNSPNDLTVHSDGSIYFTDPPFGINSSQRELPYTGVFRIAPDGTLHLLADSLYYPNGIVLSPDESTLYVSTSHQLTVVAYDVANHVLSNGRIFAALSGSGAADGMKVDEEGRLYVTGPKGVAIFSSEGVLLDEINVPEQTTNLAWGDEDGKTLYMTSGTGLYRIRMTSGTGTEKKTKTTAPAIKVEHYPSPSIGAATMRYDLPESGRVRIVLVDALGRTQLRVDDGLQLAGPHEVELDMTSLPASAYFYRIENGHTATTGTIVQAR